MKLDYVSTFRRHKSTAVSVTARKAATCYSNATLPLCRAGFFDLGTTGAVNVCLIASSDTFCSQSLRAMSNQAAKHALTSSKGQMAQFKVVELAQGRG